jgi:hypothetical protein
MQLTPPEISVISYEIFIFVLLLAVGTILLYRYYKKRMGNILILAICILVFSVAPLFHTLDILYFSRTALWEHASFGYNMAYIFSAYGNILLALFFLRIYQKEHVNLIVLIYAILNIVNTSLLIYTTVQIALSGIIINQMIYLIFHLLLALILYIYMIRAAIISSEKEVTLKVRRGFQLIALFGLFLLLAFVFFIADFILGAHYSPWVYVGWTCAAIGAILAYLGYVMPDWLKKRWEEPDILEA